MKCPSRLIGLTQVVLQIHLPGPKPSPSMDLLSFCVMKGTMLHLAGVPAMSLTKWVKHTQRLPLLFPTPCLAGTSLMSQLMVKEHGTAWTIAIMSHLISRSHSLIIHQSYSDASALEEQRMYAVSRLTKRRVHVDSYDCVNG